MDFVDFDSVKYADYARSGTLPSRVMHRWEAKTMFALEKTTAGRADVSLFVSEAEAALFRREAGLSRATVRALPNGIDVDYFRPDSGFAPLPPRAGPLIVFTGQMSYRPNAEAVTVFAEEILPALRTRRPDLEFAIVGRNPPLDVQALGTKAGVIVTGAVPDVRPWLAAASVVVAPLRIARGIQNKVLEAMAMAKPVVASPAAFEGIDAVPGRDLLVAEEAGATAAAVSRLLADPGAIGAAARRQMALNYRWEARLAPLAAMVDPGQRREAA
jgi:sugar transferase (PEP-CTERM/EpsH1 system associated)